MTTLKATWTDGYTSIIIKENDTYRHEGSNRLFATIESLQEFYKGTIKTLEELK